MFRTRLTSGNEDGIRPSGTLSAASMEARKHRLGWWTLATLSVSLLIVIVDDTIVNLALPTLQRELGASSSALQWIVNAYIVVFGGFLLATGTLGDRFGRRRFLHLGLLVFAVSSLYGAFAVSATELIVARTRAGVWSFRKAGTGGGPSCRSPRDGPLDRVACRTSPPATRARMQAGANRRRG